MPNSDAIQTITRQQALAHLTSLRASPSVDETITGAFYRGVLNKVRSVTDCVVEPGGVKRGAQGLSGSVRTRRQAYLAPHLKGQAGAMLAPSAARPSITTITEEFAGLWSRYGDASHGERILSSKRTERVFEMRKCGIE